MTTKRGLKFLIFFLIILISLFIFIKNNFYIETNINKNQKKLEYGKHLIDETSVYLKGKYLLKKDFNISDKIIFNNINEEKIGNYNVSYVVNYFIWSDKGTKEIEIIDTKKPILELIGNKEIELQFNESYIEEGFKAIDNYDGDISYLVKINRKIEENKEIISYTIEDSSNNETTIERVINYVDKVSPILTLDETISNMYIDERYKEITYSAIDDKDGDITEKVEIDLSNVDFKKSGTYIIYYKVKDNANNESIIERILNIEERVINEDSKIIYLTFDDGPSKYTKNLLEILDKYNVKVTFFVVNNPKYNYLIKEAYDKGHSIGITSLTHNYSNIYNSKENYYKDLFAMRDIIKEQIGIDVDILRFPGGSSNQVSAKYCKGIMSDLSKDVVDKGFQYFDWNVTSGDAGSTGTSNGVYKNVITSIRNKKISIVLQHDTKKFSIEAVEDIIKWGLENGYTFLPLTKESFIVHHSISN